MNGERMVCGTGKGIENTPPLVTVCGVFASLCLVSPQHVVSLLPAMVVRARRAGAPTDEAQTAAVARAMDAVGTVAGEAREDEEEAKESKEGKEGEESKAGEGKEEETAAGAGEAGAGEGSPAADVESKVQLLSVESTPEFMQLPLEFQGFCPWTIVHRHGLLLPGNPALGEWVGGYE
jgi:hypothetical protein